MSDCRYFLGNLDEVRLRFPTWPYPNIYSGRNFVHYASKVRERRNGGMDGFAGENYLCDLRRGLRISDLRNIDNKCWEAKLTRKYIQSDGQSYAQASVVFKIRDSNGIGVRDLLTTLLEGKSLVVVGEDEKHVGTLASMSADIARFYSYATSVKGCADSFLTNGRAECKSVLGCTPCVYIKEDIDRHIVMPDSFSRFSVRNIPGMHAEIWGGFIKINNVKILTCIFKFRKSNCATRERSLRLSIQRICSESQSVCAAIRWLLDLSDESTQRLDAKRVHSWFDGKNGILSKIQHDKNAMLRYDRYGEIIEFALDTYRSLTHNEIEQALSLFSQSLLTKRGLSEIWEKAPVPPVVVPDPKVETFILLALDRLAQAVGHQIETTNELKADLTRYIMEGAKKSPDKKMQDMCVNSICEIVPDVATGVITGILKSIVVPLI
jgi:hypothetical protein